MSLLIALVLVNGLLTAAEWLFGPARAVWVAVEALVVVAVFAAIPQSRTSTVFAALVSATIVLMALLMFANWVAYESLGRPLNLYLDLALARSVVHLLTGSLGVTAASLILVGVSGGLVCLASLLTWLLAPVGASRRNMLARPATALGLGVSVVALAGDGTLLLGERLGAPAVKFAVEQSTRLREMLGERATFGLEIGAAPASYAGLPALLHRVRGRDVLLGFIESYGMTAIEDPRYASVIRPRLHELDADMHAAGLHIASGTLVAPTQGGQSWFSHLSVLSGLWVDNQLRYDVLIASGRETLIDDFRRAGHRTIALMPANTMAWPEGARLGYDEILGHRDIEYAGPALNWVTMPDQYTWSYLEHRVRRSALDMRPVFVELGLISSHAPWTPILPVIEDWGRIGDGAVFRPWRDAGLRPRDLWLDHELVRQHYALALDYAVGVVSSYAARYVDPRTLLLVMGDHQPAPLITGDDADRRVPVHVISGDPSLVQPFLDWGFEPGAFPTGTPSRGMDEFRDWFVHAFSRP